MAAGTVGLFAGVLVACGSGETAAPRCRPSAETLAVNHSGRGSDGLAEVWIFRHGRSRALITGEWVATKPSFSPDGLRVAVTRATGDYESAGPDSTDISVVDADGSNARQLTAAADLELFDDAAWSPDGASLAVSNREPGSESSTIQVIPAEGGTARALTQPPTGAEDSAPAWSPDGQEVAYLRRTHGPTGTRNEIRAVGRTGKNDHRVASVGRAEMLDWNPRGGSLLVSTTERFGDGLSTVDVTSGEVRDLGSGSNARWSGDGRHVHYLAYDGERDYWRLAIGHIDGGRLVRDQVVPGFGVGFLYPYLGLAVDRCG